MDKRNMTEEEKLVDDILRRREAKAAKRLQEIIQRKAAEKIAKTLKD